MHPEFLHSHRARSAALIACTLLSTAAWSQTSWTKIAAEWQSFSVQGTQTVRFGAGQQWLQRSVTGPGQCTNSFFGGDPAVGITKSCEAQSAAATPPPTTPSPTTPPPATDWTPVAMEYQTFTLNGAQLVRYGADTRWVQKTVASGVCTNAFFGSDPAPGVTKSCQVQVASTPTPTPTPPPTPATAALAWSASSGASVSGYRVYYGTTSNAYSQPAGAGVSVGNTTSHTISGLQSGYRYYFAVTAVDSQGQESAYSNEVSKLIP